MRMSNGSERMDPAERAELDRQRDRVQAENAAVVNRRATIERLRADESKAASLRFDAGQIVKYRSEMGYSVDRPSFYNVEVERLFDAEVSAFRERLEKLAQELST